MEFLETLETIRQESADVQTLFGSEGQRANRGARNPVYEAKLVKAIDFVAEVMSGRRDARLMAEAMTTSDFPILFGDILDRQVLAEYQLVTPTWTAVAKRRTVRDFRGVKLYKPLTGGAGRLAPVGQLGEYPEVTLDEHATATLTVKKYGRRMSFSWEANINDDLQQLQDMPGRMSRAAVRTENYMATELYVDSSGPHASLYSDGNKNVVDIANGATVDNPALSFRSLASALLVFGSQVDDDGDLIAHDAVTLVVPPALEIIANNIVNATSLELTTLGGLSGTDGANEIRLLGANWLSKRVKIVVNPIIPTIATSNGNTSWFLFANPNSDREAITLAFLRGWENPAVFIKSPNASRVGGGGEINPMDGDFDTDAITYKIRHVLGAGRVDPKATVASDGTGGYEGVDGS